jgi:cytochrome c peroxidase
MLAVALPCIVWPAVARATGDWVPPSDLRTLQAPFHQPEQIPFPADNQFTAERELLGRTLFFDPRLSGSGVLACATCHNPSFGWGDGMQLGRGEGMQLLGRRTPTVLNAAWGGPYFWDGRAATLEAQASGPIGSPKEMNQNMALLPAKLKAIDGYQALFDRAYPGEAINIVTITKAISTFERTISSGRTPFDDWLDGDEGAVGAAAKRGFVLFTGEAHCSACHSGWAFTDHKFHDIGLASPDVGRALVAPGEANAEHAFKTQTLRDVARRAPYMHDGSQRDLSTVINHYIGGGDRPGSDPLLQPLALSPADVEDLIAFLGTLSGPAKSFPAPILPR